MYILVQDAPHESGAASDESGIPYENDIVIAPVELWAPWLHRKWN